MTQVFGYICWMAKLKKQVDKRVAAKSSKQSDSTPHHDADDDVGTDPVSPLGIFGLETNAADAKIHLLPIPWEVTTSYGRGASFGPAAILRASRQVDLFDFETGDAWKVGYFMHPISADWMKKNRLLKEKAQERLEFIEAGEESESSASMRDEINGASSELNAWVTSEAEKSLNDGKIVGVIGGDHSSPFGLVDAVSRKFQGDFGILHFDAHADLRASYQGYENSHASIMHNVIEKLKPRVLVQVGIRDFCREEYDYSEARRSLSGEVGSGRIVTHYDRTMKKRLFAGENFDSIIKTVLADLPKNVYVSFDIDGLDPALCPSTGTPVPGGLSFDQATAILAALGESGRRIVGFDVNEVSEPALGESEWDANVGARLLFKLCGWTAVTNGLSERVK
ncbi:agmatinase family protein [soil metagenome]